MRDRREVGYREKSLRLVRDELEVVLDFAGEWDELPEDEQIMTYLEWRDAMGHLASLEVEHTAGRLTKSEEARYSKLKADLKEALPIIERLGLRSPSEVLGEQAP